MQVDKTKFLIFKTLVDTIYLCQLARKEGGHVDQTFELACSLSETVGAILCAGCKSLPKGGDIIKQYTNSFAEAKCLMADGYKLLAISYFVSNPVATYMLER